MLKLTHLFLSFLILLVSGCVTNKQQNLPFAVIEESIAFPTKEKDIDKFPQIIVISELEEIAQLDFAEKTTVYLDKVDFDQVFVLLILRGQLKDSGTAQEVTRIGGEVVVKAQKIDPSPGSYVISGFSPPYQIIEVEKLDTWDDYFDFLLDREGVGVVSRTTVYVP